MPIPYNTQLLLRREKPPVRAQAGLLPILVWGIYTEFYNQFYLKPAQAT